MKKFVFASLIGLLLVISIAPTSISAADSSGLEQPLKTLAETNDLLIGTAVRYGALVSDPIYGEVLAREFNVITVENMMKFSFIHPNQDEYDFTRADAIVDFAEQNDMKIRGHCLVWNQSLPSWLTEGNWSRAELKQILRDHIKTVVKHYRGRVFAWDVLNEAIAGGGRLRQTFWYQNIGPGYLGMVFRWAHQADPNALLFYNDYLCEGLGDKSDGVYGLMKKLVKYNIPIDGIGLQMHLNIDEHPSPEEITANMKRLAALGLEIHVTEMTVYIRDEVTQEKLDQQAEIYRDIMEVCLSVDACKTFVMWGFTDLHSHLSDNPNRGSALIFDESYQPKPAYYALIDVLKPEESPPPPEEEPPEKEPEHPWWWYWWQNHR